MPGKRFRGSRESETRPVEDVHREAQFAGARRFVGRDVFFSGYAHGPVQREVVSQFHGLGDDVRAVRQHLAVHRPRGVEGGQDVHEEHVEEGVKIAFYVVRRSGDVCFVCCAASTLVDHLRKRRHALHSGAQRLQDRGGGPVHEREDGRSGESVFLRDAGLHEIRDGVEVLVAERRSRRQHTPVLSQNDIEQRFKIRRGLRDGLVWNLYRLEHDAGGVVDERVGRGAPQRIGHRPRHVGAGERLTRTLDDLYEFLKKLTRPPRQHRHVDVQNVFALPILKEGSHDVAKLLRDVCTRRGDPPDKVFSTALVRRVKENSQRYEGDFHAGVP